MKSVKYLKKIMDDKGLNIKQLADKTNTPATTLYSGFDRNTEPSMELILKVAYALQMNPMDLLEEMEADSSMMDMMMFISSQETELLKLRKKIEARLNLLDYPGMQKLEQLIGSFLQLSEKEQRLSLRYMDLFLEDLRIDETCQDEKI